MCPRRLRLFSSPRREGSAHTRTHRAFENASILKSFNVFHLFSWFVLEICSQILKILKHLKKNPCIFKNVRNAFWNSKSMKYINIEKRKPFVFSIWFDELYKTILKTKMKTSSVFHLFPCIIKSHFYETKHQKVMILEEKPSVFLNSNMRKPMVISICFSKT